VIAFSRLIGALAASDAEFIIVGGIAGVLHGAARSTYDLDVVYARDRRNLERLVAALAPLNPYPRGAPSGLPFRFDTETLAHGLNFTLSTEAGDIDLLGEIVGGGTYEALLPYSSEMDVLGTRCRVLALPKLIAVKRAAGRPRDFDAIAELEALLEETDRLS
jgi:hypothetical protein